MCKAEFKKTIPLTIFLFIFMVITDSIFLHSNPGKDHREILETGERLLKEGEYERAVDEFLNAQSLIKDTKTLAVLYQLLSLAYFKMGNKERCEESLRAMFDLYPEKEINEEDYEDGYILIYHKVRAEYWYNLKSISDEEEKVEQKIIEKLAHKPKKKKSKLLRILTLSGIVVISGVLVAVLLGVIEKNDTPDTKFLGTLRIYNSSTFITVWISIADIQDVLHPMEVKSYKLRDGTYSLNFFDDNHSQTQLVEIFAEGYTSIYFYGWDESDIMKHKRQ